ncbi:UDP-N-acetylglucosamine 2-epimerase (non-hydrolyzing) [Clostridia bacterium]|nr:UDP-N-acetylglucosamine 2-epimerase (non-hydrolyzing) [Clostridia bacterium]
MKVACIFGTRPEAIKMAPVVKALKDHPFFETQVIVTAQHREMLDQVLQLFGIVPDYDLDIMQKNQTLNQITARALTGLGDIFAVDRPDLVLVHGDTTTTFCGALAAFYQQIPVGHVEAGLRTYNKYSPFPEEVNRTLTGVMTDYHFAPTVMAKENLLKENVAEEKIYVTGNTVIDALLSVAEKSLDVTSIEGLSALDQTKKTILVTSHRRENLGDRMTEIFRAIADIAKNYADSVQVVFPMHLNPKVREQVNAELGSRDNVFLIEPQEYLPFVSLMKHAYIILTDSGGIQEEAPALGKPVVVLRDTTERPEALLAGTVLLAGTSYQQVYNVTQTLLTKQDQYDKMSSAANPYGDGSAAERIVNLIHEKSKES